MIRRDTSERDMRRDYYIHSLEKERTVRNYDVLS
jgi:hypothetical protein